MEGTHLDSLPLEVSCNYIRRLDPITLVRLSRDPALRSQINFCVSSLRIPDDQELLFEALTQLPFVRTVSGKISLSSFQSLAPVSRQIQGDLLLVLRKGWSLYSDDLFLQIATVLRWLYVRKTLYPTHIASLRFPGTGYEFSWFPDSGKLTLYYPGGKIFQDPNNTSALNSLVDDFAPLAEKLEPLLLPLSSEVRRYEFIPYSIPDGGRGYLNTIISQNYPLFTAALSNASEDLSLLRTGKIREGS